MYKFKFTDIGEGLHEGKVSEILVKVDDVIKEGDDLFIVETEKVTTEISSPVDGIIKEILIKEGEMVSVGDITFVIDTKNDDDLQTKKDKVKKEESPASVVGEVKVSSKELPSIFGPKKDYKISQTMKKNIKIIDTQQTDQNKYFKEKKILITPLARAIALELNINLNDIKGSGPSGRILINDVRNFSKNKKELENKIQDINISIERDSKYEMEEKEFRKKVTAIRKTIASTLKRSWEKVAYTNLVTEVDVTKLVTFRKCVKDYAKETHGVNVTFLSYVLKAFSIALIKFPIFNSTYDEKTEEIVFKKYYNIGIAVDTSYGLVVPVVYDVNKKSILEISKNIRDLAKKAREKTLTTKDQMNGTFTVTNYGSVRSSFGVPVIKYPELAIGGMGTIFQRAIVEKDKVINKNIMYLTIAADHRWIDGADIGRFGFKVKCLLEAPEQLSLY